MTTAATVIEVVILSLIGVCAFCGNLLVFFSIYRDKKLRTKGGVFICCLSSADILVSVYNIPLTIASTFNSSLRAERTCEIMAYFEMLLLVVSVQSLTAISLNRYFFIIHWHKYHEYFRRRNTVLFVISIWVISGLLCLPPLIGWSKFGYKSSKGHCFVLWKADPYYTYFMAIVCFGGPIISMIVSYYRIIRYTRNTRRAVQLLATPQTQRSTSIWHTSTTETEIAKTEFVALSNGTKSVDCSDVVAHKKSAECHGWVSNSGPDASSEASLSGNETHSTAGYESPSKRSTRETRRKKSRIADEQRLTRMFIVVVIAFFVSWFPFVITMFTEFYTTVKIPSFLDKLTLLCGYANSMYNPIIYGLMNGRFRRVYVVFLDDLKGMLSCRKK